EELREVTGDDVVLTVEVVPPIAGVAEAAEIMGWDKRRVITYIDRGHFPEPLTSLAGGRVWLREDVEAYADEWRRRRAARSEAAPWARRIPATAAGSTCSAAARPTAAPGAGSGPPAASPPSRRSATRAATRPRSSRNACGACRPPPRSTPRRSPAP